MSRSIIMGFFRIRLQSSLALALWLIVSVPMRSVDGGEVYKVGGDDRGWGYTGTTFDYQKWASTIYLTVGDTLDFGESSYPVALVRSTQDLKNCNTAYGQPVPAKLNTNHVEYSCQSAVLLQFLSSNAMSCESGMKFSVMVYPVGSRSPAATPSTPSGPSTVKRKNYAVGWIVGGVTGGAVVLVLLVALVFMSRRGYWERLTKSSDPKGMGMLSYRSNARTHSHFDSSHSKDLESGEIEWPWGPQRFSYKDLKGATDSFNSSLVVGEGGFGTVYKGYLKESPGAPVAVKRLSQYARQGAREFMSELNIISRLRHRNLVQLVGWCDEDEELILVYEFMPKGDLDDLIFGGYQGDESPGFTPLSWNCRYRTFVGVATALVYLHEEWEQRVVHRDVKTSNVMLDSHSNARLGDFGLARLSAHSQAPRTTLVAGTIGYLAPEFNLTGRATDKTDVYAFGVVVLEVSCARRPLTSNCILVDWVWDLHKETKIVDAIDPKLDVRSASDEEEMKLALQVGLLCCHPDPGARPTMRHVLNVLTGETPLPKMPRSKPVAVFAEDR